MPEAGAGGKLTATPTELAPDQGLAAFPHSRRPRAAAVATAPVPAAHHRSRRLIGVRRLPSTRAAHRTGRGSRGPDPDLARPGGRRGRGQGPRRAPARPPVLPG